MREEKYQVKNISAPVKPPEEGTSLGGFLKVPANAATTLAFQILDAAESIQSLEQLIKRKTLINEGSKISMKTEEYVKPILDNAIEGEEKPTKYELEQREKQKAERAIISYETENNTIEVVHPDISSLSVAAQNLFPFFLIEACKNCVSNGELYSDNFTFKTSDLVKAGVYGDIRSAKRALVKARYTLLFLAVGQTDRTPKDKGKKTEQGAVQSFDVGVIFTRIKLNKRGECFVRISKDINWEMVTEYWTVFPLYYYRLSRRAQALMRCFIFRARQLCKYKSYFTQNPKGEEVFSFSIPFRTLQMALGLPSENTTDESGKKCFIKRASEYIKQPLLNAIEEILRLHKQYYGNNEIELLPVVDNSLNIKRWLDKGYLQVTLSGEFLKTFLDIANNRQRIIEDKANKQAKIIEEAKTRAIAKSMEQQQAASEQASEN